MFGKGRQYRPRHAIKRHGAPWDFRQQNARRLSLVDDEVQNLSAQICTKCVPVGSMISAARLFMRCVRELRRKKNGGNFSFSYDTLHMAQKLLYCCGWTLDAGWRWRWRCCSYRMVRGLA